MADDRNILPDESDEALDPERWRERGDLPETPGDVRHDREDEDAKD